MSFTVLILVMFCGSVLSQNGDTVVTTETESCFPNMCKLLKEFGVMTETQRSMETRLKETENQITDLKKKGKVKSVLGVHQKLLRCFPMEQINYCVAITVLFLPSRNNQSSVQCSNRREWTHWTRRHAHNDSLQNSDNKCWECLQSVHRYVAMFLAVLQQVSHCSHQKFLALLHHLQLVWTSLQKHYS